MLPLCATGSTAVGLRIPPASSRALSAAVSRALVAQIWLPPTRRDALTTHRARHPLACHGASECVCHISLGRALGRPLGVALACARQPDPPDRLDFRRRTAVGPAGMSRPGQQTVCEREDLVARHHTVAPAFGNASERIERAGNLPKDRCGCVSVVAEIGGGRPSLKARSGRR
jgi:hypothetical protein